MMKHEFEALAKRTVTDEQYEAIEKLYMASTMTKQEFVKSIRPMLKEIPEEDHRMIVLVTTTDRCGSEKTPNGCWWHTTWAELVNVDIATRKIYIRRIPNTYELRSSIGEWSTGYECFHYYEVEEIA